MGLKPLLLILMGLSGAADARVFSFEKENMAAYLRASAGTNSADQDAFVHSSGTGTVFGEEGTKYSFSGEMGAQMSMGSLNVRLGIEALRPKEVLIDGNNAGGSKLFTLTSEIFVWGPTLSLEYVYSSIGSVRFYSYVGGTYMMVDMDNQYDMTAAGTLAYGANDYTEKGSATGYSSQAGLGFETMFVDNVTFSMDFGYRYLVVKDLKHKHNETTIQGAVTKGDPMINDNGTERAFDLSGFTVGATFRFYIDI
jgi:hypothetical protein